MYGTMRSRIHTSISNVNGLVKFPNASVECVFYMKRKSSQIWNWFYHTVNGMDWNCSPLIAHPKCLTIQVTFTHCPHNPQGQIRDMCLAGGAGDQNINLLVSVWPSLLLSNSHAHCQAFKIIWIYQGAIWGGKQHLHSYWVEDLFVTNLLHLTNCWPIKYLHLHIPHIFFQCDCCSSTAHLPVIAMKAKMMKTWHQTDDVQFCIINLSAVFLYLW